ncbi:MAG TPA: hypothetical protein VHT71_01565, partial [Methylomirabilota bacterium]|nr:hypothetical protein [Methylomirabilota bacterium]
MMLLRAVLAVTLVLALAAASLVAQPAVPIAQAQSVAKVHHIGIVLEGGPYHAAVDGLRDGLKAL